MIERIERIVKKTINEMMSEKSIEDEVIDIIMNNRSENNIYDGYGFRFYIKGDIKLKYKGMPLRYLGFNEEYVDCVFSDGNSKSITCKFSNIPERFQKMILEKIKNY